MEYYRRQIRDILDDMPESRAVQCPPWYKSLADGIFAELYGLAGLEPWIYNEKEEYIYSSSAKLIGERIYRCLLYTSRCV